MQIETKMIYLNNGIFVMFLCPICALILSAHCVLPLSILQYGRVFFLFFSVTAFLYLPSLNTSLNSTVS